MNQVVHLHVYFAKNAPDLPLLQLLSRRMGFAQQSQRKQRRLSRTHISIEGQTVVRAIGGQLDCRA